MPQWSQNSPVSYLQLHTRAPESVTPHAERFEIVFFIYTFFIAHSLAFKLVTRETVGFHEAPLRCVILW
jgi:hypothetical protein